MDSTVKFFRNVTVVFLILIAFACTKNKTENQKSYFDKNREFLKEMTLCHCIYSLDSSINKNEGSAGFFFNRSNYDPEVFYIIDSIIPLYKPKFVGLTGKKLGIAECIALYKSDTLMKEIQKMDKFMAKE